MTKKYPTFEAWMARIDALLARQLIGLTSEDLVDCDYAGWFDDGVSPSEAVRKVIKNQY